MLMLFKVEGILIGCQCYTVYQLEEYRSESHSNDIVLLCRFRCICGMDFPTEINKHIHSIRGAGQERPKLSGEDIRALYLFTKPPRFRQEAFVKVWTSLL